MVFEEEPGAEAVPFEAGAGVEETVLEGAAEEDDAACAFPLILQAVEEWPAALGVTRKTPEQASPAEPAQTLQNCLSS